MNQVFFKPLFIGLFILAASTFVSAQTGALSGTITSEVNKQPLGGVSVEITQLRRSVETDESGQYEFTGIPNGTFTVVTHLDGFADKAKTVQMAGGKAATLDFVLSLAAIRAEVTVTATGSEEAVLESFSSVSSVGTARIAEKASTSLGEVLEGEAGVTKRSFGPGSSRPSIRGFEGDRVLVLQDGVRNGSVGSQSGDHGEPTSTLNLERLEVIKGPATLLYGSNAIGGVVNAVSNDENDAHPGIRGYFTTLGGIVNRSGGVAGGVELGIKKFLFDLNLNAAREGDFKTPFGRIPNSGSNARGGSGGVGYFAEKGFVRGTFNLDRRRYGIPYAPLFESGEILSIANGGIDCTVNPDCQFDLDAIKNAFADQLPPVPDEDIDIRMRRNNFRIAGGFRDLKGPVSAGNFHIDFSDYQHQEIETADGLDTVATTFDNDVFSFRGSFEQSGFKNLSGRFGYDGYRRSYLTQGAEQLIEGRVRQNNFAVFVLEELSFDRVSLQFGGRVETNRYRPTNANLSDTEFTGFSGAIGVKFRVWQGGNIVANFSSSYRSPALEELYNFGPHIGTVSFEVGDEALQRERSNSVEFSLRQDSKRVRFNGSVFYYNIDNFIYLAPQDVDGNGFVDVEDGLPLTNYVQDKSRFVGADASLEVDLNDHFGAYFVGDLVNAKIMNINTPLPRISPARIRAGLNLTYKGLSLRPEGVFVGNKGPEDIFSLETATAGYGAFNINGTYAFVVKEVSHIFTFGVQNLTDKLYRNHVNFIKDLLPEAGRGFKVSYMVRFN